MIVAISGSLCSGKQSLALFLEKHYNFRVVSLYQQFGEIGDAKEQDSVVMREFYSSSNKVLVTRIYEKFFAKLKEDYTQKFVVYPFIMNQEMSQYISDKYQVLLYEIEAPIVQRMARYQTKYQTISLEDFVLLDDSVSFSRKSDNNLKVIQTFINQSDSLDSFYSQLQKYNFLNTELIRPQWDTYFLRLAEIVATRSNCMKRQVGCVIVNDFRIVSTGYNGTPFGFTNCNEGGCDRCNESAASGTRLDECMCIHAEENAVIEAGRAKAKGGTIYCTLSPCLTCSKSIVQAGITKIIFNRKYNMPVAEEFWKKYLGTIEVVQHQI